MTTSFLNSGSTITRGLAVDDSKSESVLLGEPLDQMLNAECKYSFQCSINAPTAIGGLVLPTASSPGTGNIVIRGHAGTGKSTLALQMLVEAARRNNDVCGAYISLEETQAHVFEKAKKSGWSPYVWPLNHAFPVDATASAAELADNLQTVLKQPMACTASDALMHEIGTEWPSGELPFEQHDECPYSMGKMNQVESENTCHFWHRCESAQEDSQKLFHAKNSRADAQEHVESPGIVILPQLLPRPFNPETSADSEGGIFWPRYRQLDDLLRAAEFVAANPKKGPRNIRLVCIDCLNAFGTGGLTRDHLVALFDLFKRRQMQGILVVEENDRGIFAGDSQIDSDTIDFLADMVIRLTGIDEEGYWLRHFHIVKSRHQPHVLGRHPFKIVGQKEKVHPASPAKADATATAERATGNSLRKDGLVNDSQPDTVLPEFPEDPREGQSESASGVHSVSELISDVDKQGQEEVDQDASLKNLQEHLKNWKIGCPWRRRFPPDTGIRLFPSVHTIVAASEHLAEPEETHTHSPDRWIWSSENLGKMVRLMPTTDSQVFTVVGPATSGKSLIAGNFLLEGLFSGEDVLLIRFSERADFSAEGSWSPDPQDAGVSRSRNRKDRRANFFATDALRRLVSKAEYDALARESEKTTHATRKAFDAKPSVRPFFEAQRAAQVTVLEAFLSTFGPQKIQFRIHEFDEGLRKNVIDADKEAKQATRKPLLVEIAMRPGALLPEEFVAIVREVYRWGRHFRQREGFGIRRAALLDVHLIGAQYPLLKHSSTTAGLFLSSLTHILRCRKTDFMMTAQVSGVPESENVMKKAVSLADHVITCEHCDVFGDRYITVRGPGLIEGDMIRARSPELVPAVFRRQRDRQHKDEEPRGADYFEVDFTTLQGLVGFSSGDIRRPGVCLQLFEEGTLHAAYNSQVARLVRFAMGSEGSGKLDSLPDEEPRRRAFSPSLPVVSTRESPTVTVDSFDSVYANPFHHSLELLQGAPLHNTVLRTIDEFAIRNTLVKDVAEKVQERLLYAHLYYRNVLLLACDQKTQADLIQFKEDPFDFWHMVETLAERDGLTILCDHRAQETLACLAIDGLLPLERGRCRRVPKPWVAALPNYLDLMSRILPKAYPLFSTDASSELSPQARELVQTPEQRARMHLERLRREQVGRAVAEQISDALKSLSPSQDGSAETHRYLILCWYSHLRELIAKYESATQNGDLDSSAVRKVVGAMQVLALPGKGFRGDWYLEVPAGSVSEFLGKGIKDALLRPEEDLKRFIEGIGIPSWPRKGTTFCSKAQRRKLDTLRSEDVEQAEARFEHLKKAAEPGRKLLKAWPGGSVTLDYVMSRHCEANRRSELPGYAKVRGELYGVMKTLMDQNETGITVDREAIAKYVVSLATRAATNK